MWKIFKLISIAVFIISCDANNTRITEYAGEQEIKPMNDTTPKVTGIGGIFFKAKNPKKVKEWYGKNFGLAIDEFGSPFEFRNAHQPEEINYLNWDAFEDTSIHIRSIF